MRSPFFHRFLFLAILLAVLYLAQRFWFLRGWRLIDVIQRPAWRYVLHAAWIGAALVIVAAILDPMLGQFIPRRGFGAWVRTVSRLWLAASAVAFLAVVAVEAVEFMSRSAAYALPVAGWHRFDPARRTFFRYATYLAGVVPFVAASYGFGTERLRYQVERVEVALAHWPKLLDGLRIVQLSDIHMGEFMPRAEVRRAVDIANEQGADLAIITGDLISDSNDPLADCIAELSRLRAPLGIWGCNGNHEIYADAEAAVQELYARYGMRLLRQQSAELEYRGEKFNLLGVDYQRSRTLAGERVAMLQGVEPLVRRDIPNILLSHNPNSFYRAAELGVELSLAGHTHGGQIRVEFVDRGWSPARFITDFVAGLYKLPMREGARPNGEGQTPSALLYVNRGLGTFGMPVRLGVPPEITVLTLRSSA